MAKLSRLGIVLLSSMPLLSLGSHSNHLARHNSALKHSDAPFAAHGAHMLQRDDYTCSADRPCENGACCDSTGNCGYGDTYCGKGCQSNCDAKAECGKDASPRGKKCPLNTCCSEFGFCGTTKVRYKACILQQRADRSDYRISAKGNVSPIAIWIPSLPRDLPRTRHSVRVSLFDELHYQASLGIPTRG